MIIGELKTFQDQTLLNRLTPGWLHQGLAAWNVERDIYETSIGPVATLGAFTLDHEVYKRGFRDDRSGIAVGPGESCVMLHISDEIRYGDYKKDEAPGILLDRTRFSLGCVNYYLDTLSPDAQPEYVMGHSHRQMVRAAGYLGFHTMPMPRAQSEYARAIYQRFYWASHRSPKERARLGPPHTSWLAYLPTQEFRERFPAPLGPRHSRTKPQLNFYKLEKV